MNEVTINEKTLEVLVAKFIPTSQYFERSFKVLQIQIDGLREGQKDLKADMDRRFEQVDEGQKDLKADMDRRFEQVDESQKDLKADMNRRFEQVDRQFEQVDRQFEQVHRQFERVDKSQKDLKADMDKRFEQVDKRFEQVDSRFDQINGKLDTIIERMDVKIDAGLRENRSISIRLFSFAMVFSAISMAGLLAKMLGLL